MRDSTGSNVLLCGVFSFERSSVTTGGSTHSLQARFSRSRYGNECYCKNIGDGFLTSAQEDFSLCFENDCRATQGKET